MGRQNGGRIAVAPAVFRAWRPESRVRGSGSRRLAPGRRARHLAPDRGDAKRRVRQPRAVRVPGRRTHSWSRQFDASEGTGAVSNVVSFPISRGYVAQRLQRRRHGVSRTAHHKSTPSRWLVAGVMPRDFRFPRMEHRNLAPLRLPRRTGRTSATVPIVYTKRAAVVPAADALRVATERGARIRDP